MAHRSELVGQLSMQLAREDVPHDIIAQPGTIRSIVEAHIDELGRTYYNARTPWRVASVDTINKRKDLGRWASTVGLLFVDEAHHVQVDLKLKRECEAPLMRGAPDNGIWHNLQRGRWVSQLLYDAPEHILFFRDDDKGNQQRYSEIGGVDTQYLQHLIRNLKTRRVQSGGTISQAVYFRRASNDVRIVDT